MWPDIPFGSMARYGARVAVNHVAGMKIAVQVERSARLPLKARRRSPVPLRRSAAGKLCRCISAQAVEPIVEEMMIRQICRAELQRSSEALRSRLRSTSRLTAGENLGKFSPGTARSINIARDVRIFRQ